MQELQSMTVADLEIRRDELLLEMDEMDAYSLTWDAADAELESVMLELEARGK